MKKINKLTAEQKAMTPVWVKKWVDIGLRTGESDWGTFNQYMPICYEKAGLRYPTRVVRVPSPFFGAHVASVAAAIWERQYKDKNDPVHDSVYDSVGASVNDSVYDPVRASVSASVRASVSASVRDSVCDSVGDSVYDSVRASVRDSVGASVSASVRASVSASVRDSVCDSVSASVRASVGDSVYDSVRASVSASVSAYEQKIINTCQEILNRNKITKTSWNYWLGGQFWVGGWWGSPAFVSFFTEVCGLELDKDIQERATAYQKVCESVNYIWPNRDFIIVSERPVHIDRDDKGRLHSMTHKAICYPDGWGLYMIHGVRFEESEFTKFTSGELTALDIMSEKNQDKKRVMAMEYGNEKLIKELKAKECSSEIDDQGNIMKVYSIKMGEGEDNLVIYEGICPSKGEKVYLRVPPEFADKTAYEAKCWGFPVLWEAAQKTKEKLQLIQET